MEESEEDGSQGLEVFSLEYFHLYASALRKRKYNQQLFDGNTKTKNTWLFQKSNMLTLGRKKNKPVKFFFLFKIFF